jgi:cytochrome c553
MKIAFVSLVALLATGAVQAEAEFNVEAAAGQCAACHGAEGVPSDPTIPIIHGQEFFYLYTQLKDYAAERRANAIMSPMAAQYDRSQMKALAQYFADKSWPTIQTKAQEGDAKLAQRAISRGQCSACHSEWQGDSRIPRVAGQQPGYLEKTMKDLKNEVRLNAPAKISVMKKVEDKEIEALARYLGDL